eukprot:752857-Hanusia_phi.AAC.3
MDDCEEVEANEDHPQEREESAMDERDERAATDGWGHQGAGQGRGMGVDEGRGKRCLGDCCQEMRSAEIRTCKENCVDRRRVSGPIERQLMHINYITRKTSTHLLSDRPLGAGRDAVARKVRVKGEKTSAKCHENVLEAQIKPSSVMLAALENRAIFVRESCKQFFSDTSNAAAAILLRVEATAMARWRTSKFPITSSPREQGLEEMAGPFKPTRGKASPNVRVSRRLVPLISSSAGSPDWDLLYATQIQTRFMRFNEGQAAQGHTLIYGYEDVWFENLCADSFFKRTFSMH